MGESDPQVHDGVGPSGRQRVEELIGEMLDGRAHRRHLRRPERRGDETPEPAVVRFVHGQHVVGEVWAG